jgi:ribosomal protein S18 acetylase RimI-like enzyme
MIDGGKIELRDERRGSGAICEEILTALPSWFGIPDSVRNYATVADQTPTVIASVAGDVGILVALTHNPYAAEIYLMAVLPHLHRQGIGRRMLAHAEASLASLGVEFLQVKTLSARRSDEGYEKTRAFYLSCGFRPLEEFPDLWDSDNPALLMIKALGSRVRST